MQRMNRPHPQSDSSGICVEKVKFPLSELRMLVKEEVKNAVKQNNTKLQVLAETVQQLQRDMDYEGSIQTLEARVEKITHRAERALSALKSEKKCRRLLTSFVDDEVVIIDGEDETRPQKKYKRRKSKTNVDITEATIEELNAQKEAVMNALKNLCRMAPTPRPLTPESEPRTTQMKESVFPCHSSSPPHKNPAVKSTSADICKTEPLPAPVSEPATLQIKESVSQCCSNDSLQANPRKKEPSYPPLPINPFPSNLPMEALSYNIPPKLTVSLALIKLPPSLSVMWTGNENELSLPPMENYSVFLTVEKIKGSGVFPEWRLLGNVAAKSLPQYITITKYKPGYKLCVAVVGKDSFGR
ncbi:activating transcription factor 7-interacting protein 1 isoform X2 [Corythoichthys intestinalis]|nr:activating transcription factor 7-interacting protein 1 isoform X2 [Corythoichthys intestinalis]